MSYRARTAYTNPRQYDRHRATGARHRWIGAREDRFLEQAFQEAAAPGDRVLDLGCGSGRITGKSLERGFSVAGLDVSAGMLAGARERLAGEEGILGLLRGDVAALPFPDDAFDGVTAFRLMGHLPPPVRAAALREIARVARHWVVLTHNHLWSLEGLSNAPGRALRPLLRPGAPPSPRRPLSFAAMRRELGDAGLAVARIDPVTPFWDEECVLLAHPVEGDPGRRDFLRRAASAPAERALPGSHGARVVRLDGRRYVVKLDRESPLAVLAYRARVWQLNLLAGDFIRPLSRCERIRAATRAMREWRARGFAAPEPQNDPADDCMVYSYLDLPSLRGRLGSEPDPAALLGRVAAEIFRRHQAAGPAPFGRAALLFHLDSRCGNILMEGDSPLWVDFDRGFRPGTPPLLLKAKELVTFTRSVAKASPPATLDAWLSAVVRAYPDPEPWEAGIAWLRRASTLWQHPAAALRRRRARTFLSRAELADRLERIAGG